MMSVELKEVWVLCSEEGSTWIAYRTEEEARQARQFAEELNKTHANDDDPGVQHLMVKHFVAAPMKEKTQKEIVGKVFGPDANWEYFQHIF